jgi:DNA topoisomerase-2
MKHVINEKKKRGKKIQKEAIHVTELPIGLWIDKFKLYCEKLKQAGILNYKNTSSTEKIDFMIEDLDDVSVLKLTSNLHTTNMVLFNHRNILTKYNTIDDIFTEYYNTRLHFYQLRKDYMISELKQKIVIHENKLKFIIMVVENQDFLKKEEVDIINILEIKNFLKVNDTFDYLLNIYIRNCTLNAIKNLEETIIKLKQELLKLENTTINKLWLNDLDQLKPYLLE